MSGKSAEHHVPSGVSLEPELICAVRDEQPDIWDRLTSVYLQRNEFTCCLCLQPQYTCKCNSTSLPPLDVYSRTHFLKIWSCLLIGFELHGPCVKNLSDNCSPQGPEIPC